MELFRAALAALRGPDGEVKVVLVRGREVAAGAARGPPRHRPLGLHRGAHLGGLHAAPQPARHGQQILYW